MWGRGGRRTWSTALLLLWAYMSSGFGVAQQQAEPFVLSPPEDLLLIDDFAAGSENAWRLRMGANVECQLEAGYVLPGISQSLMRVQGRRKDPADRDATRNWLVLERPQLPTSLPADASGLRFWLGVQTSGQLWIQAVLRTRDGKEYAALIADCSLPAGQIVEFRLPWERFEPRDKETPAPLSASAIESLALATGLGERIIYLDKITAYRQRAFSYWLDYATNHPTDNLFARGERIEIVLRPGGRMPKEATGVRYAIADYDGKIVAAGKRYWTERPQEIRFLGPTAPGYYELRAFLIDRQGQDLQTFSCIRAEGSMPPGVGTFAVLPTTLEENIARFRALGEKAFFGLHGDFHQLADRIGLCWRMDYSAWRWREPTKPETRPAPWAQQALAEPPRPDYRFHLQPFVFNLRNGLPEWARNESPRAPAFRDWADALGHLRDHILVEKHLYPHMKTRLYGGAWEINLNMPPYHFAPEFTPEDVVELFRRIREVVKLEDPQAYVLGPCPSVLDLNWFETIFRAGLLRYVDGIETHAYNNENAYTPEEYDLAGRIQRLKELIRRYNNGRLLPIYVTERGELGTLGARPVYREQAQHMVRAAIMLKGEGVRVFFPFYGIDYDSGAYGFLFNLELDAPAGPWHTKRVSPKPLVNVMATCAQMLEGAAPAGRITELGEKIWAYRFIKDKRTTIIALWRPGEPQAVQLPISRGLRPAVYDVIGRAMPIVAKQGKLSLTVCADPIYVVLRSTAAGARP